MGAPTRKFNPGFLTDDELVESYCVRTAEFELLVEALRDCTGSSNPHQLVIGPRGSGKTTLLLRIAAEVPRDAALAVNCFPVVFAEESYDVATTGEFWLECLTNLADQAPRRQDEPDLHHTADELRGIRDDDRTLADRCLGALLDFADREHKRLLLLVENLNMLFRDMADPDEGWRLRKTLQTESRIILFASATSRFEDIDHPDRALYDLFRVRTLRPLDTEQCAVLWETVTGRHPAPPTVRSLEILTGGSPRLISIVARFGAGLSFRELMADLFDLVDDHTEYFKSHIESLPAQERRVYLALAALWKPATTREIADRARVGTSTCSAQLARLAERGVVQIAGGTARRKQYYLTERLYNIYYLLRRRRGPDRLVEALIHFMESYYSPPELKDISTRMVHDAGGLGADMGSLHRTALDSLMELPSLAEYRDELLAMMPAGGRGSTRADERAASALFKTARKFQDRAEEAVAAYDELVRRFGESEISAVLEWVAKGLVNKGAALDKLNRPREALECCDEVVRRFGDSHTPAGLELVASALVNKGIYLGALNRPRDALEACDEVIRRFGESDIPAVRESVATALINKGVAFNLLNLPEDALEVYDEVIRRFGESDTPALLESVATALVSRGGVLGMLHRPQDMLEISDEVIRRFGNTETPAIRERVARAHVNRGTALEALDRRQDALKAYDEVVRRFGKSEISALRESVATALVNKGAALDALNRPQDTLETYDEVIHRFGNSETSTLRESVATALVNKGVALGALSRLQEALEACDEVVRRFGKSEIPALMESVATALVNRAAALGALNRPQEALEAGDEVVRRFGGTAIPTLMKGVATALYNKGVSLGALNRPQDALDAFNEIVRRYGESTVPEIGAEVNDALLRRAQIEIEGRQYETAAETAGRVIERSEGRSPVQQMRGRLIRATALLALGNRSACEHDVEAVLALPGSFLRRGVLALIVLSVPLGPQRMRELIQASPSADLLLPLTVALERELGHQPRVAREVDEVARDIQQTLATLSADRSRRPQERDGCPLVFLGPTSTYPCLPEPDSPA